MSVSEHLPPVLSELVTEYKEGVFRVVGNELRVYTGHPFEQGDRSMIGSVHKVKAGLWTAEQSPLFFNTLKPFAAPRTYQPLIFHHSDTTPPSTIDFRFLGKNRINALEIILCSGDSKPLLAMEYKEAAVETIYGNEEAIVILLGVHNDEQGTGRFWHWIVAVKAYYREQLRNYKVGIELSPEILTLTVKAGSTFGPFTNEDRVLHIYSDKAPNIEGKGIIDLEEYPLIQRLQSDFVKLCAVEVNTVMYYPGYLEDLLLETVNKPRIINKLTIERKALTPLLVNWSYNNIINYEYSNLSFKEYTNFILRAPNAQLTYDDLAAFLGRYRRKTPEAWDRGAKKVKELQPFLPKHFTSLLDIGCNDGVITAALQKEYKLDKAQTYCIDVKEVKNDALTSIQYDNKRKIPLPDGSVDVVLLLEVLHHSLSPVEVLSEASRVLKEKGRLIIAEHDADGTPAFVEGLDLIHWIYDIVNKEGNPGGYAHYMTKEEINSLVGAFFVPGVVKLEERRNDPLRRYYAAYNNRG